MDEIIKHECAGNVFCSKGFSIIDLERIVRSHIRDTCVWPYVGLFDPNVRALVTIHANSIDITRIEVFPKRHGHFRRVIDMMASIAAKLGVCLSISSACSKRIFSILQRNPDSWHRLGKRSFQYRFTPTA